MACCKSLRKFYEMKRRKRLAKRNTRRSQITRTASREELTPTTTPTTTDVFSRPPEEAGQGNASES